MEIFGQRDRFEKSPITGLSEDIIDFIFEESGKYTDLKTFNGSFYHVCSEMVIKGVDLTEKQMNIIEREYEKVKIGRMNEDK